MCKLRVVGYDITTLNDAESKYHSSGQEVCALKWAICNRFNEHLFQILMS